MHVNHLTTSCFTTQRRYGLFGKDVYRSNLPISSPSSSPPPLALPSPLFITTANYRCILSKNRKTSTPNIPLNTGVLSLPKQLFTPKMLSPQRASLTSDNFNQRRKPLQTLSLITTYTLLFRRKLIMIRLAVVSA